MEPAKCENKNENKNEIKYKNENLEKLLQVISRSATVTLSTRLSQYLMAYFSSAQLLVAVVCIHVLLSTVKTVPGFTAVWDTLKRIVQSVMIRAMVGWVSSPSNMVSIVHLLITIQFLECVPLINGLVGQDLEAFTINVTYIFSERLTSLFNSANIPLFGATLAITLHGDGLMGKTAMFTGFTALTTYLFNAVMGAGEMSLAWPVVVLYFIADLRGATEFDSFIHLGLIDASDAVYSGLESLGVPPQNIAMLFIFLVNMLPLDRIWTGICALVFVQACSVFGLQQIGFVSGTDPCLAMLSIVTVVYFCVLAVHSNR